MYEYFFYFQVHFLVYSKKMIEMFIWSGRKVRGEYAIGFINSIR